MLTRRTERFRELAEGVELRLSALGIAVDPKGIDASIRERVDEVAQLLGVTTRTALAHAPEDLPDQVAREIALTVLALEQGRERTTRRHLRIVP